MSLPSWERGLKLHPVCVMQERAEVAPLVGARIEICNYAEKERGFMSLPSWERGLKFLVL